MVNVCGKLTFTEYHIQTAAPIQGYTWRVKDRPRSGRPRITTDRVDRSLCLATLRNRRITARIVQMTSWHAVSVQTIRNRQIPERCSEASPNSWSNNWLQWWPDLPVRCGSLLALRDFGKSLLEPTSLLWAVYFVVVMILGHNSGIWKGIDTPIKWYNPLIYEPINPRSIALQRQYSEVFVHSLVWTIMTSRGGALKIYRWVSKEWSQPRTMGY